MMNNMVYKNDLIDNFSVLQYGFFVTCYAFHICH